MQPKILTQMGNNKTWSSQRVNSRAFVPIVFTNDTVAIISSKNEDFYVLSNRTPSHMSKWFTANKLVLNLYKGKATPVTGHEGPQGCGPLRLPHLLDNGLTEGGKVVSPTRQPPFTPPQ
jgi:hypothetical protein